MSCQRQIKLVASVAAAGVVTVAMVSVDALTRDSMPTRRPAELVDVQVRSALLLPAAARRGLRRSRAPFAIRLRVTNVSGRRLTLRRPTLRAGRAKVRLSRESRASALLNPLSRRATVEDELRFNTAGELTRRLAEGRRVQLRIAGQTVPVRRQPLISVPASG